jgi:hypothetical protein
MLSPAAIARNKSEEKRQLYIDEASTLLPLPHEEKEEECGLSATSINTSLSLS